MDPITVTVLVVGAILGGYAINENGKRNAQEEARNAQEERDRAAEAANKEKNKRRKAEFELLKSINENLHLYFKSISETGKINDPKKYLILKAALRETTRIQNKYEKNSDEFKTADIKRIKSLQKLFEGKLENDEYETLFKKLFKKYKEEILDDFYKDIQSIVESYKTDIDISKKEIVNAKNIMARAQNRINRGKADDSDEEDLKIAKTTINEHEKIIESKQRKISDSSFLLTIIWKVNYDPLKDYESNESMRILLKLTNNKPLTVEDRQFMNAIYMKHHKDIKAEMA